VWTRDIGEAWITCEDRIEDGRWVRDPATIRLYAPDELDAATARRLAADLLNAADLLDG